MRSGFGFFAIISEERRYPYVKLALEFYRLFRLPTDAMSGNTLGKLFCVTSFGDSIISSVANSKKILQTLHFEKMYYRKDIGFEFQ